MNKCICILVALLLSGCASNGFQKFYRPFDGVTPDKIAEMRENAPSESPTIERDYSGDKIALAAAYEKRGYYAIGVSSFNGAGGLNEAGAIKQGKAVGADLVLLISPQYTGTRTGVTSYTSPTTTTSRTTANATAYGSGGTIYANGNSTTTTYGSKTNYIPYNIDRFDYGAVYFIKRKIIFGVILQSPTDDQRRQLQSNRGALVKTVINGSPAFYADILPGDILLKVGDIDIYDPDSFNTSMAKYQHQNVKIELFRSGEIIHKSVQIK